MNKEEEIERGRGRGEEREREMKTNFEGSKFLLKRVYVSEAFGLFRENEKIYFRCTRR